MEKQKKQIVLVIVATMILCVATLVDDRMEYRDQVQNGILRGKSPEEIYTDTFIARTEEGEKQYVDVVVYPRQLETAQCQMLLEKAIEEFEQSYLGENPSPDEVRTDLIFLPSFCQGMVQAQYSSNVPERIWEDGTINGEGLSQDGETVTIEVTLICQEVQMDYIRHVSVKPLVMTSAEERKETYEMAVGDLEEKTRNNARFLLPTEIDGEKVVWSKEVDANAGVFALLGAVAVVFLMRKEKQRALQQKVRRERMLERAYPQMVTQISLLMGAGMTLSTAWERMVKRYLQTQVEQNGKTGAEAVYMEEMLITYKEIVEGANIKSAYERFGNRIGLPQYRKLSALLIQNMSKGTRDIVELLDAEVRMAIEEQKRNIRKLGEEAGTKLLFPMLLLLLLVLIVIMVPAMKNF